MLLFSEVSLYKVLSQQGALSRRPESLGAGLEGRGAATNTAGLEQGPPPCLLLPEEGGLPLIPVARPSVSPGAQRGGAGDCSLEPLRPRAQ